MRRQDRTVESVAALLAERAHGVVTRTELLDAGVTPESIERRLRKGSLHRVHRGVYRVGHRAPSVEATYLAAVRACGADALLCGRAAAHLWRLIRGEPPAPEVVSPTERRVEKVSTRRSRRMDAYDADVVAGIPVSSVAFTLVDLAAALDQDELARACHEAGVLHRTTPAQVEAALVRLPNRPGGRALRRVVHGDVRVTLSVLERRFLDWLLAEGLPLPVTNRPAGARGRRVDCRWPEHRLTVELDSYRFHASRHAWEQDRRREREARARGDEFRRYACGDVCESPNPMRRELRALLAAERPG